MSLEIGDVAPPFRLHDQDGVEHSLIALEPAQRALKACRELLS